MLQCKNQFNGILKIVITELVSFGFTFDCLIFQCTFIICFQIKIKDDNIEALQFEICELEYKLKSLVKEVTLRNESFELFNFHWNVLIKHTDIN